MVWAAVCSKAAVQLLLISCWLLLPSWCNVSVPCFVVHCFVSFLASQSSRWGRQSWLLYFVCLSVIVLWFFLAVPWVGLQCVIVLFPDHTHLFLLRRWFCCCVFIVLLFYKTDFVLPILHKCEESVPNPHTCEKSVPNPHIYEKLVSNHHMWKICIKTHTCEELVPNYHIYKELVLNRHRCQWQNCDELETNAKCSRFGGYFINVRDTHVCYIYTKFDFVRFFPQSVRYWYEICDLLVPIFHVLWGICTNSSQCEIYEVRNLRFNTAYFVRFQYHVMLNW